jgi:hypothetical protein
LSNATMSALFTSPPTPCNISAPSTWKSTSTSSVNGSPWVLFVFYMYPPHRSSPTSSPRAFPPPSSWIFAPVWTFVPPTLRLLGVLEPSLLCQVLTQLAPWVVFRLGWPLGASSSLI